MRRLFATGVSALGLALGCVDAPVEVPPDNGGPATSDAETGDGDGDPGDGDGGPGDGEAGDGDGEAGDGDGEPGDGDGEGFAFASPVTTEVFAFSDLQLGDLDADGCADLVLAATGLPPRVNIYPSACDGSFAGPAITHDLSSFDGFTLGDLDGDERADLLARGTGFPPRIEARLSTAGFGLGPEQISEVYDYDRLWAVDLTGDGRAEALTHALEAVPSTVFVWSGPGDGSLEELSSSEVGSFDAAAVGRIDDDPHGDLVTGLGEVPVVNPWLGEADGALSSGALVWPFSFSKLALGDLDGDGLDELLTDVPGNDWRVTIYANAGGSLSDAAEDLSAVSYTRLRSADVDGDGDGDLVITPSGAPPRVMVWLAQ